MEGDALMGTDKTKHAGLLNAEELIITKGAQYLNCLTCYFCVQDNVYNVYEAKRDADI